MATSTPRPPHFRPSGSSRLPFASSLTDTPTPASSTSTSTAHHSMMQSALPGSTSSFNNKQQTSHYRSHSASRPLKPLSTTTRLTNISNQSTQLDSLLSGVEAIEADETELERKRHEESFENLMKDLQEARISSSESGASSASSRREKFRDEEGETSDSLGDDEDEEDGSIRIGLSGIRYRPNQHLEPEEEEDVGHDSDELTYLTIPRSQLDPNSPVKPLSSDNNVFSSTTRSPAASSRQSKENQPPQTTSASANSRSKQPFLSTFSPPIRASPAPVVNNRQQTALSGGGGGAVGYRSSPLNPLQNSPVLAHSNSSSNLHSRTRSISSTSGNNIRPSPIRERAGGKPVTIEEVSDRGTPPRSNNTQNQYRYASSPLRRSGEGGAIGTTTTPGAGGRSLRLPDMTFLTEALQSPIVKRNKGSERSPGYVRRDAGRPMGAGGGGSGSVKTNSSGGSKSKEAPLISGALESLTSKLSLLEQENVQSSNRVRELESQLSQLQHRDIDHSRRRRDEADEIEERVRREMMDLLEGERERRLQLEELVQQLQSQPPQAQPNVRATRSSTQQKREKEEERACSTAIELKDEVQDLRFGLQSLGYEVEGVRTIVEGLLNDQEERAQQAQAKTKARQSEQDERRQNGLVPHKERNDGTDERPGTPRSESGGSSRISFISAEEIERLQREQAIELERRTPKKAQRSHRVPKRALSISSSYDSAHDSTYSPSLSSSVSSSYASTALTTPSEEEVEEEEMEPDFDRAERIFQEVERTERREKRERFKELEEQRKRSSTSKRRESTHEKSEELCKKCLGKKRDEERVKEKEKERQLRAEKEEKEKERERTKEKKRQQERELHCRTLQTVLEKLELEFKNQKKIYMELTLEYQSFSSKTPTRKRKTLAEHLKLSIDVLEEKAKDVKEYADALEDLYHSNPTPSSSAPQRHHHHHH